MGQETIPRVHSTDPLTTNQRLVLAGVFVSTLVLYLWALDVNGIRNSYYTLAVSAGSNGWLAMFFGSLDTSNFITVDKPPLSLWVQSLSVRAFGYNSWAIHAPQVAAGLGTAWLVYDSVRRIWGSWAGIAASAVLAVTPIAVVMSRSNLPDSIMVLCMVGGAWMLTRALLGTDRSLWWLLGALAMVGLAFNAKMLQAWMVLPAFGASYLFFGPHQWGVRFRQIVASGVACLAVSLSWATAVEFWPGDAPWVGGSEQGSVYDLIFGYNGLGRIFGQESSGGSGSNPDFDDGVSWFRMFNFDNAHQIAWLLPAAAAAIVLGAVVASRTRNRLISAGITLWGGWLATHVLVFSGAEGIYHPYYTLAMAPAIAALIGAGVVMVWRWRQHWSVVSATVAVLLGTAGLAWMLFERASWNTWVGPVAVVAAVLASATLVAGFMFNRQHVTRFGLVGGLVAAIAVMTVYSSASITGIADDTNPTAGPSSMSESDNNQGQRANSAQAQTQVGGQPQVDAQAQTQVGGRGRQGGDADGEAELGRDAPVAGGDQAQTGDDRSRDNVNDSDDATELTSWLVERWSDESWIVAVSGHTLASPITIAGDGVPVMAMGGFRGFDEGIPTVEQISQYVADGELRFVVSEGEDADIQSWLETNCTMATDAPIANLYDCAAVAS